MSLPELSDRERKVLEAVIQSYVETAEPAGSRTLSRRFGLGVSPATIRNTMSDLEDKGFLFHPHTSAGRIPTDKGYRVYVDSLLRTRPVPSTIRDRMAEEIGAGGSAIDAILRRAALTLGVLTQELGIALAPKLAATILERLELVRASSDRLILVLTLRGGLMRTIFVDVKGEVAENAVGEVARVLNERLAGLSLEEIRSSLGTRLRDSTSATEARELLNIFVQEGDQLFDLKVPIGDSAVVLGQPSLLAGQPEFATGQGMRELMALTETGQHLATFLGGRGAGNEISISIGSEHGDPRLGKFTVITSGYTAGGLSGVIGVIGPTRMPYEKVISLVRHTSQLVGDLLE